MKSKDPEFRTPIDRESFRCFKCDGVQLKNTEGIGMNEVEPGVSALMCTDCFKPSKVPKAES